MTRRTALSLLSAPAIAQTGPTGPPARVPRPAAEFAIQMVNNKQPLLLSQFKGKVVCVEFLLTTCPHCQNASQILQKLYTEYGPRGFQPVGIAINPENEEMAKLLVPTYTQSFKLTWPIGWSPRSPVYDYLERPQLYQLFMPTIVFIDKKWNIRAQHIGNEDFFKDEEKNMRKMIEMLLAESSGGAPRAAAKKKAS